MFGKKSKDEEIKKFNDWDYLRIKQIYDCLEQRPGKEVLVFLREEPWELYQIELYKTGKDEIITLISDYRVRRVLITNVGMKPAEARDLIYEANRLFSSGSDEWAWYPQRPAN